MYDIVWDPETGGILLKEAEPEGLKSEIRPVFHEELDLLGFQEKWRYPQAKEPLLWATSVGRRYFYRGECVAEARGGSFFQAPTIHFFRPDLTLEPVDVAAMLAKNASFLRNLTQEAITFIRQAQDREGQRVAIAAVAFSGGKDSLTLLDLVQRALCPDEYVVVFNDTQMEIAPTYAAVDQAKARWPHLRFYTSRCHKPPEQTWREFGPPSRIHRWCCSVHKSVPNLLLLRRLADNPAARVLVYDGVRAEESPARSAYGRISPGGKHGTQINIRPIFKWNTGEIFLYLLDRGIFIHAAYRFGLSRVGCAVCPMASDWSECIHALAFPNDCKKLLSILAEYYTKKGIDCSADKIGSRAWKARAGGRDLTGTAKVIETKRDGIIKFLIREPAAKWLEWAKTLGEISYSGNGSGTIAGSSVIWKFKQQPQKNSITIQITGAGNIDRYALSHLRAVAQKAAYCVHCRACEVECPTGAITMKNAVKVTAEKCRHCFQCLEFVSKGCLAGKSLQFNQESTILKGLDRYRSFGMRKQWLQEFLNDPKNWWHENKVGNRQFEAMQVWLKESELIEKNELTPLGQALLRYDADHGGLWQILWANLARNSILIRWYLSTIKWGEGFARNQLIDLLGNDLAQRTKENAITALLNLFENTPLGNRLGIGKISKVKGIRRIEKIGLGENVSKTAVLYSIYRYAELVERYDLFLDEFYDHPQEGPFYVYGIAKEDLRKILLGLSSAHPNLLAVEFVKDLDNLYVFRHITSHSILMLTNEL